MRIIACLNDSFRLGHPLPSEEIEDALSDRQRTLVKHWSIMAMAFENPSRSVGSTANTFLWVKHGLFKISIQFELRILMQ
jgi:hypothetical protein